MGATTRTCCEASSRKHTISLARGREDRSLAAARELLVERHAGPRVAVGDVADVERPVRRAVDERPWGGTPGSGCRTTTRGRRRAARASCPGRPCSRGRCRSGRRLPPGRETALGARLEVDDPIVFPVTPSTFSLMRSHRPLLSTWHSSKSPIFGKGAEGAGVLTVDDAAEHLVGHARAERGGVHPVVGARMDLPDVAVGARTAPSRRRPSRADGTGHRSGRAAGPG